MTALYAHGLVGRADLPIPTWLFGWAAAVINPVTEAAAAPALAPRLDAARSRTTPRARRTK